MEIPTDSAGNIYVDNVSVNYVVFIPSYDRLQTVQETTLKLLDKHKIPKNLITFFLETEKMTEEYKQALGEEYNYITTFTKGICEKRNYLEYYAHDLQKKLNKSINVIHIDDDIEDIVDYNRSIRNLTHLIQVGFDSCYKSGCHFFGISPFHNKFFLKRKITTSLKYVCGAFYGEVIDGTREPVIVDVDHGEDLQRSMEAFIRDDGIVRINHIALHTAYFPNSGITAYCGGREERKKEMITNCTYLADRYSDMCKYVVNKWGATVRLNHHYKNKKL